MKREEALEVMNILRFGTYGEIINTHEIVNDALDVAIEALKERPHGECNQCRHYEGVHGVQGHAPCSFWGIGGVLSSDYCSRFEKEGEAE